ncbi:D-alanine--D-alanine ligase family protein [Thermaerobacter subterraneus]|uniref:D-alanine--D-alanine ligase n=1 Tax=Thermaerobacter subterraneus DSM 13965 TaxID=867903 RepID=K6PPV9_9FIRM|nr:D-alanine--D-alanine ligase family protein [Thermaerobacter subterraneus]EKP94962.1 D-alanine--D-alanine ligase [Thermaerobacter subterraneus DSM 13965]
MQEHAAAPQGGGPAPAPRRQDGGRTTGPAAAGPGAAPGPRRLRVGILFGGRSGEHEVSLMSARSVFEAMDRRRFEPVPIGITREGLWILPHDAPGLLKAGRGVEPGDGIPLAVVPGPQGSRLLLLEAGGGAGSSAAGGAGEDGAPVQGRRLEPLDVVFPVLHGTFGEDGTVQGLLELAGIPYVGAGVMASAVGMDKAVMKELFRARGLPVVPFLVVTAARWRREPAAVLDAIEQSLGYPCFTKPANLGSSVGITRCPDRVALEAGLAEAFAYDRKVVVERGVDARELEISVLGNDDPVASVPGEIRPRDAFYTYRAKYTEGGSELIVPAPLPPRVVEEMQRLAIAAFQAIDAAGLARVDFFLERATGRLLVNEINTIPGFTVLSMYPKLWEAAGLPYRDLITRLIELALERHGERARLRTTYGDGE